MNIAHDLYAETNPAFVTFAIVNFYRNYTTSNSSPADVALVYLAVPIAMSDDTELSFNETNARTGLLAWLTRYPAIRYDLGARLDASVPIVTAALRFGLNSRVLRLSKDGMLQLGINTLPSSIVNHLAPGPKQVLRRAERLGIWMSKAGAPATIFSAFGVSP